jgi:hypothetical protein
VLVAFHVWDLVLCCIHLLSCLSLSSLYHHASADSTFASTTIDAAAASSAATDPSDKMTPDELTILLSNGGELKNIISVGGNFFKKDTQECSGEGEFCLQFTWCCGESCLLLYDDIDFTFDNILLLCDSIFKLALSV